MTGAEAILVVLSRMRPPVDKGGGALSCMILREDDYYAVRAALIEARDQLAQSGAVITQLEQQILEFTKQEILKEIADDRTKNT